MRGDTLILCYHAISPTWDSRLAVTPDQLAQQVAILAERGYRGVTFAEAVHGAEGGRRVAITFDDACDSVFELGMPILSRAGFPGTVFVPTAFPSKPDVPMSWPGIDQWADSSDRRELLPISWERARELRRSGWEIGSHTVNHPRLTDLEEERLLAELTESRSKIEAELGEPCRSIAFPYGDTDARVRDAVRRAGYELAAALPGNKWSPPCAINSPRVGVYRGDDVMAFKRKISPVLRRLRHSRAWPGLAVPARHLRRHP